MSEAVTQLEMRLPQAKLLERCARLGLPVWRYSHHGRLLEAPSDPGPSGQWLRCSAVERLVSSAVASWMDEDVAAAHEAFPGCWLIPMMEMQRRRRRAVTVAMALTDEALEDEVFLRSCSECRLDAGAVVESIRMMVVGNERQLSRLAHLLTWMGEDLSVIGKHEHELSCFSKQLTDSYEEINLLYTLGEQMTAVEQPKRFVRTVCDELHAAMQFDWVSAYIDWEKSVEGTMASGIFVSGELPCSRRAFEQACERVLVEVTETGPMVLSGSQCGAMVSTDSQVVLHCVHREGRFRAVVFAGNKHGDDPVVSGTDMKLLNAAAGQLSVLLENAVLYDDQRSMFFGTLEALTASLDAKDPYTCGHSERVAYLASSLALASGMSEEQAARVRIGGLVHDVGKIGVREAVLRKPGRLTDEEFEEIKKHPEIGYHILRDITLLEDVLPGVLYHHERYDGRGYPSGLSGEAIPLIARLIGLADAFDAMSSNRTYRSALDRTKVLSEIREGAGTQFDPELAEAFLTLDLSEYDRMVARHQTMAETGYDRFGRRGAAA